MPGSPPDSAKLLSVEQALASLLADATPRSDTEMVPLTQAHGRITARPLLSDVDAPPAATSAMDGYAVNTQDMTPESSRRMPISQRIAASEGAQPLRPGTAARVFTGSPVPPGADAVVVQEACLVEGDCLEVRGAVAPGQYIRAAGEDFRRGSVIVAAGTRLTPRQLGLAAAAGCVEIAVSRPPRVAVLATGNELVQPGDSLPPGKIFNSNQFIITALLQRIGCPVTPFGIIPDTPAATRTALLEAASAADMVISTGGASVGEEDHTKTALRAVGRLHLWRVAMRPGRPLIFGHVDAVPFFGLPGNPVSAFVTFCLFVRPYILRLMGVSEVAPRSLRLPAAFSWTEPSDRRQYLRARLIRDGDGTSTVECFSNQSSGVLTSLAWADGLAVIPEGQRLRAGQPVEFIPFSELMD
jgi:molybdopterin molybdotransferase